MNAPAHATQSGVTDAPRSRGARVVLSAFGVLLFAVFIALGTWQVQRLGWKLDLIERVNARVHAAPIAAPGPAMWPVISRADDEYRRVQITGEFENERETLVQASTDLGAGFWVLTPLRVDGGWHVLVNRGFVPPEARDRQARQQTETPGTVRITGLLRMTEPDGGFLRDNDAAGNRWFSRDVEAIAQARGLTDPAPYFIDQEADPASPAPAAPLGKANETWPAPGLTVIAFRNHHLMYALTWYTLALMVVAGAWVAFRNGRKNPSKPDTDDH